MNETVSITRHGSETSCYRLRHEPVRLFARTYLGAVPDGDSWAPEYEESFGTEKVSTRVKPGMPRKQAAARIAVPVNTVKVVPVLKPVDPKVALAQLGAKTEEQARIEALEARIKELLGLVRK
jgi:hypothetical protein